MAESKSKKAEGLTYKGHPLRRVDNLIDRAGADTCAEVTCLWCAEHVRGGSGIRRPAEPDPGTGRFGQAAQERASGKPKILRRISVALH